MANCTDIIKAIRSGEEGIRQAMAMIYMDPEFQKIAKYRYEKCYCAKLADGIHPKQVCDALEWEDYFWEAIEHFIGTVLGGTEVENCKPYFYGFTGRDICKKLCRKLREGIMAEDDPDEYNLDGIFQVFNKLGRQCQLVMLWYCFCRGKRGNPESQQLLHEILRMNGYKVEFNVLSALIYNCKKSLRELLN